MGIRCADHVTPLYPQKLALTSPTGGGRSVGIVHVRTKATEFFCYSTVSTPLLLLLLEELYNITLRKRQHGTLRICIIYLFIKRAPYCDKPCKYQAPRNVFNHMRLPSDVAVGKDIRFGQKISLHGVNIRS